MLDNNSSSEFQCFCGDRIPERIKLGIRNSVCKGLPLYKELNNKPYCVLHYPDISKETEVETEFEKILTERVKSKEFDFRGIWFPSDVIFTAQDFIEPVDFSFAFINGNTDFSWSYFEDSAHFECTYFNGVFQFNQGKLKDSYFAGSEFNSFVSFYANRFNESCDFSNVKFNKVVEFCESQFYDTAFFDEAIFEDTANFFHTDFHRIEHTSGSFRWAEFKSSITFSHAHFASEADFSNARFYDALDFDGNYGEIINLSLQFATFEKPEKVLFFRMKLHPNWFIHIDSRKFVFTDIYWGNLLEPSKGVIAELEIINRKGVFSLDISNPYLLLKIACRQLSENAENNNRFEEASKLRQMAFETEWLEKKEQFSNWIKNLVPESEKLKRRFGGSTDEEDKPIPPTNSFGILRRSGDFFIHGLYRITSFYGESWSWALGVLLSLILVIFPTIYTQINFQTCSKDRPIAASLTVCESKDEEIRKNCACSTDRITFTDAIVQSLTTATLQNVEYRKPLTVWGEIWIILEKIFAPLQAALLALAIRRKFMR